MTYASGRVGQTFSFDGISSYVEVANFPAITTELTIEFWIQRQRGQGQTLYI